ncbi:MAG: hypothetical protein ACOYJR_07215 [Acutalibacteraceae bacterium]|jgi:hypothetical protein
MFVAIISSLFFLAVACLLRSEPMCNLPLLQPISLYFFAEAAWTLLSGILLLCWRDAAEWASFGHYALMAVAAGYVFYCGCNVYQTHKKNDDSGMNGEKGKKTRDEEKSSGQAPKA